MDSLLVVLLGLLFACASGAQLFAAAQCLSAPERALRAVGVACLKTAIVLAIVAGAIVWEGLT